MPPDFHKSVRLNPLSGPSRLALNPTVLRLRPIRGPEGFVGWARASFAFFRPLASLFLERRRELRGDETAFTVQLGIPSIP